MNENKKHVRKPSSISALCGLIVIGKLFNKDDFIHGIESKFLRGMFTSYIFPLTPIKNSHDSCDILAVHC